MQPGPLNESTRRRYAQSLRRCVIVGVEMLLQAIAIDINSVPKRQHSTHEYLR
jgi:hypothetical protein